MFQAWLKTPFGPLLCSFEGDCVLGLHFGPTRKPAPAARRTPFLDRVAAQLEAFLTGASRSIDLRFRTGEGTEFQRRVWEVARTIPYGEVRTYAWVAERMGSPRACRAVGQALGRNPLPLLIPCHRVVASGGGLGGFTGGLDVKRRLLQLEGSLGRDGALRCTHTCRED